MGNNGVTLRIGSELNEFTIKKVLGSGTFGITYLAEDNYLNKKVVIKEYFPNDIAIRKSNTTIAPKTDGDKDNFEYGLDSFLKEAQTLAKFNHPNIVRINSFCESNNTAYFIMDYEEGEDLEVYLQKNPQLSEKEILAIMLPLLDGLREVHDKSYLHRDIKPGNIYIKSDGSPILIDFGATRYSIGVKSQSLSIILTPGYAPKEQYSSKSKQAPYTDIYAIGAVMYKMVTDATPVEASERANAITDDEPDPHIKLMDMNYPKYSDNFKKAIDWAMEFKPKDRPQSVRELQKALEGKFEEEEDTPPTPPSPQPEKPTPDETNNNSVLIIGFLVLALIIGGFFFIQNNKQKEDNPESNQQVEQLKEQNRKLENEKRLAKEEAERAKQEAQKERERIAYEKAQQERKARESKRINFNEKNSLDINNDNINLTISYPVNVKRGNKINIKASLKNNGKSEPRGGITLSFPQLNSIGGDVESNNFTNIQVYKKYDKVYSKTTNSKMYPKYLIIESNDEKWNEYEKHSFEITLKAPANIDTFKIQIRAALKNRVVPGSGIKDQQGYICKVITINIVD